LPWWSGLDDGIFRIFYTYRSHGFNAQFTLPLIIEKGLCQSLQASLVSKHPLDVPE
jgi:hypothetical protein